jgi:hypothetical protein
MRQASLPPGRYKVGAPPFSACEVPSLTRPQEMVRHAREQPRSAAPPCAVAVAAAAAAIAPPRARRQPPLIVRVPPRGQEEIRLGKTPQERDEYERMADLFAIVSATERLEQAYVRDIVDAEE